MSIKSCIRLVPLVKNILNFQHSCVSRPVLVHFHNSNKSSFTLCNQVDVRLFSTTSQKDLKPIYYGILTPQIKAVKIFSLSSSIVGILAQPVLYQEITATGNVPVIIAAYSFIGFFTVVTPLLLHFITKKYITHLDYKESTDSYIARTVNFFCRTKETEFTPNDVVVPDVPGMFTTFHAKGVPLFLDPRLFDQPEHYGRIMGYDKPLDFKLSPEVETEGRPLKKG